MRKFLVLGLLAGCTQMTDFHPNAQVVEIQGREFFVNAEPARGPGVYFAGPNDPAAAEVFLGSGFALPAANVAAIEAVTGCPVLRETVKNLNTGTTFAAVAC